LKFQPILLKFKLILLKSKSILLKPVANVNILDKLFTGLYIAE